MDKYYLINYNRLFNLTDNQLIDILLGDNLYLASIAKDIIFEKRINDMDEVNSYKLSRVINLEEAWELKDCQNRILSKEALDFVYKSIDDSFKVLRIVK